MGIQRITLAVDDMAAMVTFYNAVFDSGLEPLGEPASFHLGDFFGIQLLLCPNEIAEVDARQNRHQFRIHVDDVDDAAQRVADAGGVVRDSTTDGDGRVLSVVDPDGNTYEFRGA